MPVTCGHGHRRSVSQCSTRLERLVETTDSGFLSAAESRGTQETPGRAVVWFVSAVRPGPAASELPGPKATLSVGVGKCRRGELQNRQLSLENSHLTHSGMNEALTVQCTGQNPETLPARADRAQCTVQRTGQYPRCYLLELTFFSFPGTKRSDRILLWPSFCSRRRLASTLCVLWSPRSF